MVRRAADDETEPSFLQAAPELGNQYDDDRVLRGYLRRALPPEVLAEIEPELRDLGELAGGELYRLAARRPAERAAADPLGAPGASASTRSR